MNTLTRSYMLSVAAWATKRNGKFGTKWIKVGTQKTVLYSGNFPLEHTPSLTSLTHGIQFFRGKCYHARCVLVDGYLKQHPFKSEMNVDSNHPSSTCPTNIFSWIIALCISPFVFFSLKALKSLHGQVTLRKRIWRNWNFWLVLVFFSHQLHIKHPAAKAISVSGCGWGQITTGQRKSTSPWAQLQSFGHGQKLPFHWRKREKSS